MQRKHLPKVLLLLVLSLIWSSQILAKDLIRSVQGRVAKVSDGDTIQVITDNETKIKVRLAGIDSPETPKINRKTGAVNKPGQPYGEDAQKFGELLVNRKTVQVDIYGIDQYKRMLAFVFVDGKNLNLELVRQGLAEVYKGGVYGPYKQELISGEMQAKRAKIGMWSLGDKYESPRDFRKRLKVRGD